MAILPVQWPGDELVDLVHLGPSLLGDVTHDRVHRLGLVVTLLALDNILGRDTTLGKVDVAWMSTEPRREQRRAVEQRHQRSLVEGSAGSGEWQEGSVGRYKRTLLLVDPHNDDDLVPSDSNELLDTTDAPPRELGKEDHALNVVVLEL